MATNRSWQRVQHAARRVVADSHWGFRAGRDGPPTLSRRVTAFVTNWRPHKGVLPTRWARENTLHKTPAVSRQGSRVHVYSILASPSRVYGLLGPALGENTCLNQAHIRPCDSWDAQTRALQHLRLSPLLGYAQRGVSYTAAPAFYSPRTQTSALRRKPVVSVQQPNRPLSTQLRHSCLPAPLQGVLLGQPRCSQGAQDSFHVGLVPEGVPVVSIAVQGHIGP